MRTCCSNSNEEYVSRNWWKHRQRHTTWIYCNLIEMIESSYCNQTPCFWWIPNTITTFLDISTCWKKHSIFLYINFYPFSLSYPKIETTDTENVEKFHRNDYTILSQHSFCVLKLKQKQKDIIFNFRLKEFELHDSWRCNPIHILSLNCDEHQ